VVSRWSGSVTDSSATEVASLAVDAGVTELAAPRSSSTCPVSASTTVAETRVPSRWSASGPASLRATPVAVCGGPAGGAASTGVGATSGLGVGLAVAVGPAAPSAAPPRPATTTPPITAAAPTASALPPAIATRAPVHRTTRSLGVSSHRYGRVTAP
jgi:hypothetical protein